MAVLTNAPRTRVGERYQPGVVSVTGDWFTVIPAGGVDGADNSGSTVLRPDLITSAERTLVEVEGQATHLLLRVGYAAAMSTDPVLQAFGKDGAEQDVTSGEWNRLQALDGNYTVTLADDTTNDVSDGTLQYTSTDLVNGTTVFDLQGHKYFMVCVKTAGVGTSIASAIVQAKLI